MMSALNSYVVWALTTKGERPFQHRKTEGKELFRASLVVRCLQYWALCDDLVVFEL